MTNEKDKKIIKKDSNGKGLFPSIKKEVKYLLTSEEAKISSKNIITGAVSMFALSILAEQAFASHCNWHDNLAPHHSFAPHYNYDATHTSITPHSSTAPHVSSAAHNNTNPLHNNTHANVNESVTKGEIYNSPTDGYGKHTASLGHNNNPNTHNNTSVHINNAHIDTTTHSSAVMGHLNAGHHGSAAPHYNMAPHHNAHNSHGSHYSHGQW